MRRFIAGLMIVVPFALPRSSCATAAAETVVKPIKLFNGKDLTNFYTFLKDSGKNNDPEKVFTVEAGMIRVSGKIFGYFMTEKEYENYHLVTEFKWGQDTWKPRDGRARDSGILLHCVGKDQVWPKSIECQMIEGGTGDIILVGGTTVTARVEKRGKQYYFNPDASPMMIKGSRINWYGRDPEWKDVAGFRGKQDVEKPLGDWNRLECICDGGNLTYILNGKVINAATNASETKGRILFQSEGAEVYFRRIDLLPLKK